ncbi:MAG TPA: RNA 2',3'-cyclic phosphodiesterase [Solirubrobacteraceae bacterium]|jgi:2'-5' RNA ligase|nr:RNA 2',3'-cyclic phosphodiesterase [Solirubrobacteraceae bacterium]
MSRSATARLFVAIDPPAAVREQLAAWARLAVGALGVDRRAGAPRGVRLLEPETMHLTLCFLGGRPVEEIETIAAALDGLAASGGELLLGAPLWLPPRSPRSLALAIHDRHGELAALHEVVQGALADAIDWQPDRRRFRAHVTVARLGRERSRGRTDVASSMAPPTPQLSFVPAEVVLYRSWLAPAGASYEALTASVLSAPSDSSPEGAGGAGEDPAVP